MATACLIGFLAFTSADTFRLKQFWDERSQSGISK
jgi:hypothetical protein